MQRRSSNILLELLPAAAFTAFLVVSTVLDANERSQTPSAAGFALIVVAGLALALHRRAPLAGYAVAVAATVGYLATGNDGGPIYVAPLVALLPVVAARPPALWVPAALAGTAALVVATGLTDGWGVDLIGAVTVSLIPPFVYGAYLRLRQDQIAIARAETRGRATAERLRMAQELHDVVGHSLSTISLHAGVAERALDTKPEQVRESVQAIRQASKEALGELRALLAILRQDGTPEVSPTPSLDAIETLVASVREAGLDVELEESRSEAARVPDIVGAAAYRIVQEALTNVVRHAGGAPARVKVRVGRGGVDVEVRDSGPGPYNGVRSGNGITGMRERATALGGELHVGGRRGRGFFVRAKLPVRR